jgi:hypothetical protein
MTGVVRTGHSLLGMASFAASVVPGALLAGAYLQVMSFVNAQPPRADTVAYAFWIAALTVLCEAMALGLGWREIYNGGASGRSRSWA